MVCGCRRPSTCRAPALVCFVQNMIMRACMHTHERPVTDPLFRNFLIYYTPLDVVSRNRNWAAQHHGTYQHALKLHSSI